VYLIGFDNREVSAVCRPKLSTVALPLFEIGQTAGRLLLDTLEGTPSPAREIMLECTIIRRESTGK